MLTMFDAVIIPVIWIIISALICYVIEEIIPKYCPILQKLINALDKYLEN